MTTPFVSRGASGFAGAVFAGCLSAAILALALHHSDTLLFFIAYLTAIPLFIAGLGAGSIAGILASAGGIVGLLLTEPSNFAVIYAFIYAVPAALLTGMALRYRAGPDGKIYWYPEGHLLTAATIYPCIVFLVMSAISWGHEGGLLGLTGEYLAGAADALKNQMDVDSAARFTSLLEFLIRFLPAMAGTSWIFITVLSVIIAQSALQRQGWHIRTGFTLHELYLPHWLLVAVAATGLVGALAPAPYNYNGENLAVILGLPFLVVGFAIVHAWAATKSASTAILIVFYLAITFFPFVVLIVVFLGVIDQWADFRLRFDRRPKSTNT